MLNVKRRLNRRDFLKLAGFLPLGIAAPKLMEEGARRLSVQGERKNVLVVVFDALSAYHLSLYGYQRQTMPTLARLAERAIVYHNHYAGGSFTTPGTASLLTGTLPWLHRALQPKSPVAEPFISQNFFTAFDDYYRIAYTHNNWANVFLEQFSNEIDEWVPWDDLFLKPYGASIYSLFKKDLDTASVSWTRNVNVNEEGYSYSLFLSHVYESLRKNQFADIQSQFPRGIPSTGDALNDFLLETAIDWAKDRLALIPQPFLGYLHFLPPHGPYHTSLEFYKHFARDGYRPVYKPEDELFTEGFDSEKLLKQRTEYDEFLLYADREFGRLFDYLGTSGLLENTWVVLTSDHGELFERGIRAHASDSLYQAQIRVPLLIFEPGRKTGMNIHMLTSAVDVLPTLLQVTGHDIPNWTEGVVLPPFETADLAPDRNVFVVKSIKTDKDAPITQGTLIMVKGRYKLLYYFGLPERGIVELIKLYDTREDPDELVDLSLARPDLASNLLNELKAKLADMNKPYSK